MAEVKETNLKILASELIVYLAGINSKDVDVAYDRYTPRFNDKFETVSPSGKPFSIGSVLKKMVNENCKTLRIECPNGYSPSNYEQMRCEIILNETNEHCGYFYVVPVLIRETFSRPFCSCWIADTEDFQVQCVGNY